MPDIDVNFHIVAPVVSIVVAALIVLILDLVLPANRVRRPLPWISAGGIGLAGWYVYDLWQKSSIGSVPSWNVTAADVTSGWTAFLGAVISDRFGLFITIIVLLSALAAIGMSVRRREADVSGYYALVLFAAAGMILLATGTTLLTVFLGLELLSLALYVVVGFRRNDMRGKEGAFKYLVLGAVASGILLYGFALLYGATGSVWLAEFQSYWYAQGAAGMTTLFKIGLALSIIGFAFKMALVPFHAWAPDAYEGAPASVSGFMAVGTKAAALAGLIRILAVAVPVEQYAAILAPLAILGALSMFVGSILATTQNNMKRLLAYSSITHAGYLIMALPGLDNQGVAAATFYLLAYLCMTIGAFAIITWLGDSPHHHTGMSQYEGLFHRRPVLASVLTLFLLSLAGIPLTAGFVGKVLLVMNALKFGGTLLIVALVVTTAISAYAYLRVVLLMIKKPEAQTDGQANTAQAPGLDALAADADGKEVQALAVEDFDVGELEFAWPLALVVTLAALGTLYWGIFPQTTIETLQALLPM